MAIIQEPLTKSSQMANTTTEDYTLDCDRGHVTVHATVERQKKRVPLTIEQIQEIVGRISYKDKSAFSVFPSHKEAYPDASVFVQIPISGDSTGTLNLRECDKILRGSIQVYGCTSEEELIMRIRSYIHALELHEADEWFKVDGIPPFDPHNSIKPIHMEYGTIVG